MVPEVLLAEERHPYVKERAGFLSCPILAGAAASGTVQPLKVDASVRVMVCRECLGPGPGVMAAASPVTGEC